MLITCSSNIIFNLLFIHFYVIMRLVFSISFLLLSPCTGDVIQVIPPPLNFSNILKSSVSVLICFNIIYSTEV